MRTLDDYLPRGGLRERMASAGFRRIKRLDLKTVCIDLHVSERHPAVSIFTWETAQGIDKALAYVRIHDETSILRVEGAML